MGLFTDLLVATQCKIPFPEAWKRVRCVRNGHDFDKSELIDKFRSKNHPQNNDDFVYTVNVMRCNNCSLIWLDSGFEARNRKDSYK